jgi:hypothetical protein
MAKNAYGNDQNSPFSWQSGDTSTFANQAQNLAEQAGDAGLNMGQIDVQNQTAQAKQKAGQSGQNAAAGADKVAEGAEVTPNMAQANTPPPLNPDGGSGTQIQPYQVTKEAPAAPSTDIKSNADFSANENYQDPTDAYLSSLFPTGIPDSIKDALAKGLANTSADQGGNGGVVDAFNQYLESLQGNIRNQANNSQDLLQYQNYLKNQYAKQQEGLNQEFNKTQGDLATQKGEKGKGISDYIDSLQKGLKDYQDRTGNLSATGGLSPAEIAAMQANGVIAGGDRGKAFSALANQGSNSKLAALSQQAESAAVDKAIGAATAAQQNAKTGEEIQAAGQKAQADAYKKAGDTISKNQENSLNKLNQSGTDAQKQLTDAYNKSKTNLTNQEQDYVNKAQDTLKNAKIPQNTIKDATNAFANMVKGYLDKGNIPEGQKASLKNQLESIWRIAVGSNPSDMAFSDQIAGTLMPILQSLGENPNWNPNNPNPAPANHTDR